MSRRNVQPEAGFSLIELIMVAFVIGILALVVSSFYTNRLIDYARNFTLTLLQSNTKQAVETMEQDIKGAQTVNATNNVVDPTGTTWTTGTSVLVLAEASKDSSGDVIYVDALHNTPCVDNLIYFIQSSVLYKRILANTVAPCNATVAKTTGCSGCPADGKVVENVATLTLSYDTPTPANAAEVTMTLQESRAKFGRTYNSTLTSKATLRNR